MPPFGVTIPATVPQRLEILKELMNYPVFPYDQHVINACLQAVSPIQPVGIATFDGICGNSQLCKTSS
jgi:hypothetical protein